MKRADDLERLIALRRIRLDRAAAALAERNAACEAARDRVTEAAARAAANGELRRAREDKLLDRLATRPLTVNEIGRAQDGLATIEAEADALDRAEQAARRALEAETERRREAARERLRLERQRDKLMTLHAGRAAAASRRAELVAELEAEDQARVRAARKGA